MAIDTSQFLQSFYEESFEGLDLMESVLLHIDIDQVDGEQVASIFRAAHSIKGGSGTFGLNAVADFTHVAETLLDKVRDGTLLLDPDIVNDLLAAVDLLRGMLNAFQNGTEVDAATVDAQRQRLEKHLDDGAMTGPYQSVASNCGPQPVEPGEVEGREAGGRQKWSIKFAPYSNFFQTGNDPARFIRVLGELGPMEVKVETAAMPPWREFDYSQCYLSWDIVVGTDAGLQAIEEIFEWVIDDCDLLIEPVAVLVGAEVPPQPEFSQPAKSGTFVPGRSTEVLPAATGTDISPALSTPGDSEKPGRSQPQPQTQTHTQPHSGTQPKPAEPEPALASAKSPVKTLASAATNKDSSSIRVSIDKIDALINMVGELVITQSMLNEFSSDFDIKRIHILQQGLSQLDRNTRELQENVMRIRMLPISHVFNRFPRLVHDAGIKLDKRIELRLHGEQTELDKTVMEKIGDPMVHLIRNALDHGIEAPAERLAAGKPETGVLSLNAFHRGGNVIIEIEDDGRGIDKEKIRQKALDKGLVQEEEINEERLYDLIFLPGLSTAKEVSDLSGRGVGMDVVKRNIRELGGSVEVASRMGEGSKFTITLPLTLAILDGQLIRVGDEVYIIPLVAIVESLQIDKANVNHVAGKSELYKLREEYIPVVRLAEFFQVQRDDKEQGLLVVLEGDGHKIGLVVDELLAQQQVVVKSLETNYNKVEGISGATILGDGTVALILDVSGLVKNVKEHNPELIEFGGKKTEAA